MPYILQKINCNTSTILKFNKLEAEDRLNLKMPFFADASML